MYIYLNHMHISRDRKKNRVAIVGRNERMLPTPAQIPWMISSWIQKGIPLLASFRLSRSVSRRSRHARGLVK